MPADPQYSCWVCGSGDVQKLQEGGFSGELSSENFAITDDEYGVTHAIFSCSNCGFRFCPEAPDVLPFYEELVDSAYEESREPRRLQADSLLRCMRRWLPGGRGMRLLDVGAGSGILVEQALAAGFDARGLEPSRWLAEQASVRGLDVLVATLPHPAIESASCEVVTLVDVIEHVSDPARVLADIHACLKDDGLLFVVTPDVSSLAARLMGRRWWHYRLAHIAYFSPATLRRLGSEAGYEEVGFARPGWYFSLDYILQRLNQYLPAWLQLPVFHWMRSLRFPLNLGDSMLLVLRPRRQETQ